MPAAKRPAANAAPIAGSNYPVIKDRATLAIVAEYAEKHAESALLEARLKVLKPMIEEAMAGAAVAYAGEHVLNLTVFAATPAKPNVKITRDMIGQVIKGSKGRGAYTQLKVT